MNFSVYTNKYFSKKTFYNIHNFIKQSPDVMIVNKKILVPIIINDIYDNNINIKYTSYIPSSIEDFETKYIYNKNNFVYAIDNIHRKLKIHENCCVNVILPDKIKKGDIILLEDNIKYFGVY